MLEDIIGFLFSLFTIGADLSSDDERKRRSAQIGCVVVGVVVVFVMVAWIILER